MRIFNKQKKFRLPLRKLQKRANLAVPHLPRSQEPFPEFVEVHLISASRSSHIHEEFLQDPSPTDVITFPYGEIFICPSVADQQRHPHKLSLEDEVLTYIIHGLLHLCGWEDHSDDDFNRMRRKQSRVRHLVLEEDKD